MLDLAKDLIQKTNADQLKWQELDAGDTPEFAAEIGKYSTTSRYHFDQDEGEGYYFLDIINRNGTVVGTVRRSRYEDGFSTLQRLYDTAMASARNLKTAIGDIRQALASGLR